MAWMLLSGAWASAPMGNEDGRDAKEHDNDGKHALGLQSQTPEHTGTCSCSETWASIHKHECKQRITLRSVRVNQTAGAAKTRNRGHVSNQKKDGPAQLCRMRTASVTNETHHTKMKERPDDTRLSI